MLLSSGIVAIASLFDVHILLLAIHKIGIDFNHIICYIYLVPLHGTRQLCRDDGSGCPSDRDREPWKRAAVQHSLGTVCGARMHDR